MRKITTLIVLLFLISVPERAFSTLSLGKRPPSVVLSGQNGGRVDGSSWSSSEIKGKVFTIFYVDPDVKDLNEKLGEVLKKKRVPREKFQAVAIINMAATWLPNFILDASLKSKQKKYSNTIFVRDKEKILVKRWNLSDDNYNVLIFNKRGEVIFAKAGKLNDTEIAEVVKLIGENV